MAKLSYRRGVGIALINKSGKVFVAERIDTPGAWQMPQGGIDKGESPRRAVARELKEEIGTAKAKIVAETTGWLRYDLPPDLVGKVWGGSHAGQEQKWFLMRFTGKDSDIDLAGKHPEFRAWKWIAFRRLPRVIVGFKRAIYRRIVAEFAPLAAEIGRARDHRAKVSASPLGRARRRPKK